jgi:hypothetical protein
VLSLRLAAPSGLHVERQRREVSRCSGSHTRSSVAMERSRTSDAQRHVQIGSEVLEPCAGVPQGKVVVAAKFLVLQSLIGDRISMMADAMDVFFPAVEHPPAEGKKHAQIQQTVLVDEMENEVRTWAGTGNPDVQAYWD